jgi:adenylate cyclase class 2
LTHGAEKKSNDFCRAGHYSSCIEGCQEFSFSVGVMAMAVETEVKIGLPDVSEFRSRLMLLKPFLIAERHFEDNFVLDYPDGRLRNKSCLLRVRKTKVGESVTFKGAPLPSRLFKQREELESEVGSADIVLRILENIGLQVWFRYQKYREEYDIAGPGGKLHLALDSTPIGDFVELEGTEEGIRAVAGALGFSESQFLRDSYYSLFAHYCGAKGQDVGHMVFAPDDHGGSAPR